jgi:hypothetical protein
MIAPEGGVLIRLEAGKWEGHTDRRSVAKPLALVGKTVVPRGECEHQTQQPADRCGVLRLRNRRRCWRLPVTTPSSPRPGLGCSFQQFCGFRRAPDIFEHAGHFRTGLTGLPRGGDGQRNVSSVETSNLRKFVYVATPVTAVPFTHEISRISHGTARPSRSSSENIVITRSPTRVSSSV